MALNSSIDSEHTLGAVFGFWNWLWSWGNVVSSSNSREDNVSRGIESIRSEEGKSLSRWDSGNLVSLDNLFSVQVDRDEVLGSINSDIESEFSSINELGWNVEEVVFSSSSGKNNVEELLCWVDPD